MPPRNRRDEAPTMAPKTAVDKRTAQVLAKVSESAAALPAAGGSLDNVDEGDSSHTVLETPAKKTNVSESSAALPAAGGSLDKVDEADSSESEGCIIEDVTDEVFITGYCRAPNSDAHPHRPYLYVPGERLARCNFCFKFFEHMPNPNRYSTTL